MRTALKGLRHPSSLSVRISYSSFSSKSCSLADQVNRVIQKDRRALAKCITSLESSVDPVYLEATQVLRALQQRKSLSFAPKIGFCGPPGAGKSSLIEKFGTFYCSRPEAPYLGVLAIDPSSQRSGGSLLGDKTRMMHLVSQPHAYVRPSPTRGALGGVAAATNEVARLLELADFGRILIETVGVGQSEVEIDNVSDLVILVIPPGAGDGLQASKRGVMEIADIVAVNKADGELLPLARRLQTNIKAALTLSQPKHSDWNPPVLLTSAYSGLGLEQLEEYVLDFISKKRGSILRARREKNIANFWRYLGNSLPNKLRGSMKQAVQKEMKEILRSIQSNQKLPREASLKLIEKLIQNLQ